MEREKSNGKFKRQTAEGRRQQAEGKRSQKANNKQIGQKGERQQQQSTAMAKTRKFRFKTA